MPRGMRGLSVEQLREMAKQGAEDALKRLRAEIIAIERTFPELALPRHRRTVRRALKTAASGPEGCLRRLARQCRHG